MRPRASACAAPSAYRRSVSSRARARTCRAHERRGVRLADVDVVAALRLRGWRENRLRQALRLAQTGRQPDTADLTRQQVVLPGRPRQVAASHALDRQRLGPSHQHRTAREQLAGLARFCRKLGRIGRHHVVCDDRTRPVEPERGDLRQDLPLVGDAGSEHVVEGRNAIGCDDEELVAEIVDVADLSLPIRRAPGN